MRREGPSAARLERLLEEAVAGLPDKQRLVFQLRYHEELGYREMAEILDTSEGSLKASFHHAVKKVGKHLERSDLV
jgi:RNA polymerase sigma factor (sigma-70 family)